MSDEKNKMDDVQKQALLGAVRTLLAVAGGALSAHGFVSDGTANEIIGAIMIIIPIIWSVANKYNSERKTQIREIIASNVAPAYPALDAGSLQPPTGDT